MTHLEHHDTRRPSRLLGLATFVASMLCVALPDAWADEPKRPPQDYGRPAPNTDAGDVAAWPVRVVLFPAWVVDELLLRRPLGWLVESVERGHWVEHATGTATPGGRNHFALLPSAVFDYGMKPSVGFDASWKGLASDDNALRLHFGTWGIDYTAIRVTDTYDLSAKERLAFDAAFSRRRDTPFWGMGPRAPQHARTRFGLETFEVAPRYELAFGRSSSFHSAAGVRALGFFEGTCCGEPALTDVVRAGGLDAPGFGQGYVGGFQRAGVVLDSRRPHPEPGSGVRLELHEEATFPVDAPAGAPRRSWIRYGGAASAAVDLTGHRRVLSFTVDAELVDKIASGAIPFTDRVSLGGDVLMRGFLRNRLVGDSAVVARLQYRWPIWVFLDAVLHADVGNVFGQHFAGFDPKLARVSSGVGLRSNNDGEPRFEALFALATDPLDEGLRVSSARILFGIHHGL